VAHLAQELLPNSETAAERLASMGKMTIDMLDGSRIPKRGDLLETNVGDRRQRTWFVLQVHPLKPTKGVPRCKVWMERWWELEPELRVKLYQSAERNGGQQVIGIKRYPAKKKPTFEQHMGDSRRRSQTLV
jgi:hypothetical protein